jgi:hypothetical protein
LPKRLGQSFKGQSGKVKTIYRKFIEAENGLGYNLHIFALNVLSSNIDPKVTRSNE